MLTLSWIVGAGCGAQAAVDEQQYYPALFRQAEHFGRIEEIEIFPHGQTTISIPLTALPLGFHFITFHPHGSSIFFQVTPTIGEPRTSGSNSDYVAELDLAHLSPRQLRGSEGVDEVKYLTAGLGGDLVFVSGSRSGEIPRICGTYQIEPEKGSTKILRQGPWPECGGATGPVSPDGTQSINSSKSGTELIDLRSGITRSLGRDIAWPAWSPNGQRIALSGDHGVVVIEVANPTRHRRVAGFSARTAVWSPDSQYLLVERSQFSCKLQLYWNYSLAVIDVARGKSANIEATHCKVDFPAIGWVRADVLP